MILEKNYNPGVQGGARILESETIHDYASTSTSLTLGAANSLLEVTSGSPTITLPTAVNNQGVDYTVKNTGSGTATLATTSSQTIDGATTQSITQYQSLTVVSNGTNWLII